MATTPNFFVVGAPKSGTSSLYHHLKMHPDVFLSTPKELNYFATDLTSPHFCHDEDWYRSRFADVKDESAVGEASVWYLFSAEAAANIARYNPDARIIAMLRNPVDMVRSYHSQRIWNQTEDERDFARALSYIQDRAAGRRLPKDPYPVEALNYLKVAHYAEQLRRYFDQFGRDRVFVVVFDDYAADAASVIRDVFGFLGVDASFEFELDMSDQARNANRRPRSEALRRWLENPKPEFVRGIVRMLVSNSDTRARLWSRLRRLNTEWVERPPADEATRQRLVEHFRPEVEDLQELLGVELVKRWKFEE